MVQAACRCSLKVGARNLCACSVRFEIKNSTYIADIFFELAYMIVYTSPRFIDCAMIINVYLTLICEKIKCL